MFPAATRYSLGGLQLCRGEASPYSEESHTYFSGGKAIFWSIGC